MAPKKNAQKKVIIVDGTSLTSGARGRGRGVTAPLSSFQGRGSDDPSVDALAPSMVWNGSNVADESLESQRSLRRDVDYKAIRALYIKYKGIRSEVINGAVDASGRRLVDFVSDKLRELSVSKKRLTSAF